MHKPQDLAKLFETITRISSVVDGGLLMSANSAILRFSVHEPVQNKSREYLKQVNSDFALTSCKESSFNLSRTLRLALQEGEKKEDICWELWGKTRLLQVKDLKKSHSVLASSIAFGRHAWSSDDLYVAYLAEATPPKSGHFWSGEENIGNQHWYKEHFGEGLKHVIDPRIFVYKTAENEVCEVKTPENLHPAQPVFRPGGQELYFVGFEKFDYKLGLNAMLNRKTKVFKKLTLDGETEEVDFGRFMGLLYPKFSPNGRFLSVLAVPEGSIAHSVCVALLVKDLETGEVREVVPVVNEFSAEFNGIYGFHEDLSSYNWIDNEKIAFKTFHNASECIFICNLTGGVREIVLPLAKPYSSAILDISSSSLLVKASNFTTPEQVYLLQSSDFEPQLIADTLHPDLTDKEKGILSKLSEEKTIIIENSSKPLKNILYHREGNRNLVVNIHGGPHSTGPVGYTLTNTLRSNLDISILVLNYSGSLGFGNTLLSSLLGRIGELDVNDCIEIIQKVKDQFGFEKIIAYGGSHGGFLSAHLASRIELNGSVVINGAVDVASMQMTTDINDWGLAEVCRKDIYLPPSPEDFKSMYSASPISRGHLVTCPVLICGGSSDMRVPSSSSQALYRVLKANKKDCKMIWYNDEGHGILGKPASYDLILNTTLWILEKFN